MSDRKPWTLAAPVPPAQRAGRDALAMLVYLTIVYVWGLWVHPLGRDYAWLADPASMPPIADRLFAWEVSAFGGSPVGYHLVNLALLYGSMLCLYRMVRLSVPGPFWLGTLAATLFMANPVHTEAVMNLSGAADLLPCFLALLALTFYAEHAAKPRAWRWVVALAYFALAVLPYRENALLAGVIVLYEYLAPQPGQRRPGRVLPFVAVSAAACVIHHTLFAGPNLDVDRMFGPLFFVFYPLGFLPETARAFVDMPWLRWPAAAAIVATVALVCRKARRRAIVFGVLSMLVVRLLQGGERVDPVHLVGGGKLLLANALYCVALVALFYRIMDHPKWRRPVVNLTTLLCVVFFGLQIQAIVAWRQAGMMARQFQADARAADAPVVILPDYQYYRGAPLCLSAAVAHDTPYSAAVAAIPLLPIHYEPGVRFEVLSWSPDEIRAAIEHAAPANLLPYPFTLARAGARLETPHAVVETLAADGARLEFRITPAGAERFPPREGPFRVCTPSPACATGSDSGKVMSGSGGAS